MNGTDKSLVSLVIPIKNRSRLFAQTVQSLLAQTHPHWEAMVVDDGSSPEEFHQIAQLASKDVRIHYLKNPGPRQGACACRNAGLAAAKGEYVLFLDSDDALAPGCLTNRIHYLSAHPDLDFAAFSAWNFHQTPGDSSALWNIMEGGNDLARFFRGDAPWQTSGPLWRRRPLRRVGPWNEKLLSCQDGEFHIRALVAGLRYAKIDQPDFYWRTTGHEGSIGGKLQVPLYIWNRIRILTRLACSLRDSGGMTPEIRQSLVILFFQSAFCTRLSHRRTLMVWNLGRKAGLVSPFEFLWCLFWKYLEIGARKLAHRCLWNWQPDGPFRTRYGGTHHSVPSSQLPLQPDSQTGMPHVS